METCQSEYIYSHNHWDLHNYVFQTHNPRMFLQQYLARLSIHDRSLIMCVGDSVSIDIAEHKGMFLSGGREEYSSM